MSTTGHPLNAHVPDAYGIEPNWVGRADTGARSGDDATEPTTFAERPPWSILQSLLSTLRDCLRTRVQLQLELLALRQQIHVLERSRPSRLRLSRADRLFWAWLSRMWTGSVCCSCWCCSCTIAGASCTSPSPPIRPRRGRHTSYARRVLGRGPSIPDLRSRSYVRSNPILSGQKVVLTMIAVCLVWPSPESDTTPAKGSPVV